MKSLISVTASLLHEQPSRANYKALFKLLLVLAGLVTLFTVLFHEIMALEGHEHSWATGVYWTLTVMTTLGFGDITFHSDLGRIFSVVVLVTGVIFMLVLLPFMFIEFFYAPWMRAQKAAQAPRKLPGDMHQHVIFTNYDEVAAALIPMLERYDHPYVVLCPTVSEALALRERNVRVAVGDLDDPETYHKMRLEHAAMLVTMRSDEVNVNVTFTARELAERIPIVATAGSDSARDVLELAGATLVLRLEELIGATLARRVSIRDSDAQVIGSLAGLVIAEAAAAGTELVGSTLAASRIRNVTGVSVIGVWNHGVLEQADPQKTITDDTVFILAGTKEQIEHFNRTYTTISTGERPRVLIVGGGRVGRATYQHLSDNQACCVTIIEKNKERVAHIPDAVIGDATQMEVLKQAGAREATTLIITSHDDDTNIALTIFFRKLRNSWKILARSTRERNVNTLLRAGADLVLSYASMGSNTILNLLRGSDHLLLAEGVNVFPANIPPSMAGKKLGDLKFRSQTGCSVIAIESNGKRVLNPEPEDVLPEQGRIFLIGSLEAEAKFLKAYPPPKVKKSKKETRR